MRLEFHQLERRWEHLRVRHPARHRHLIASLAECGQQAPIVVAERFPAPAAGNEVSHPCRGHDPNSFFVQGGDVRQFQSLLQTALP